jgi:hypothetical protein
MMMTIHRTIDLMIMTSKPYARNSCLSILDGLILDPDARYDKMYLLMRPMIRELLLILRVLDLGFPKGLSY